MPNSDFYVCPSCGYTVEYEYPNVVAPPADCPCCVNPRFALSKLNPDDITRVALKNLIGLIEGGYRKVNQPQ